MLSTKRRSKRTISLPAINKEVPIGIYVQAVKFAIANPTAEFKHGLTCWWSCTGVEVRQQFRRGMHDRINEAIPYIDRGQRLCDSCGTMTPERDIKEVPTPFLESEALCPDCRDA